MVLFTLLGVIALVQRERRKVNNTDSGRDEKVEQSDVPPVRSPDASLGQTSQHISTDPAVLPTAEEPFTCHPEVHEDSSDESLIQDLVGDLSERSADVLSGVVCKCEVDSFQTVPELSVAVPTTEEPITGHPEVDLVSIPQTSASPAEDTVAPQSSQLEESETTVMGINSCSDEIGIELSEGGFGFVHSEICMDDQVAVKLPSFKYIYFEASSEALPSELQDQHSEDEETYGALDTETKSDSEVPEVPVPADDTPEGLNKVLSGLYWRRKNCWVRGILTLAMISGIFSSIYLGPMALMTVVLCVQIKCFHEMITIGYHWYHLPWFRTLSWYFLLYVNYYFYGETPTDNFFTLVQREEPIRLLSQSHRFISFALYLTGFCMFVMSPVKRRCRLQFYMFGWTLMILATLSQLIIRNLFKGMIWFIVPISCAIYNGLRVWLLFWSHPSLQVVS